MNAYIDSIIYLMIFGILFIQVAPVFQKSTDYFKLGLFFYFFSTELSRTFFPLFVKSFTVPFLGDSMLMALPQMVWGFSALVFTPFGMVIAKKYGNRNVLLYSAAFTWLALMMTAFIDNYWVMLVARSLMAASYGSVAIVAVIYLSQKGGAKSVAVFLSSLAAASICGSVLGGALAEQYTYSQVFFVSSVLAYTAGLLFLTRFRDVPVKAAGALSKSREYLKNYRIQIFAVCGAMPFRLVITGFVLYLLPVFLHNFNFSNLEIGQLMMLYFLFSWLMVGPTAHFLDKYHLYKSTTIASSFLMAFSLLVFYLAEGHAAMVAVSIVLLAIGMSVNNSIQVPIIPRIFPQECERYGRENIVAYFRTVERVGSVIGPFLAALLFANFETRTVLFIGLFVALQSAVLWFQFLQSNNPKLEMATSH